MDNVWTVKGVKSFVGREGYGFNATLCRNGVRVAFVMDEASGGQYRYDWCDRAEEKILRDHCTTLPPVEVQGMSLPNGPDLFVGSLVDAFESAKKMKRQCKTKTLFTTPDCGDGRYFQIAMPFCDRVKAHVLSKHPNATFINETCI